MFGLVQNSLPLTLGNQACVVEIGGHLLYALKVFALVFPGTVAWAKVLDAASVSINDCTGRSSRAFVLIVGHAILVAVHLDLAPDCVMWQRDSIARGKRHVQIPLSVCELDNLFGGNRQPPYEQVVELA